MRLGFVRCRFVRFGLVRPRPGGQQTCRATSSASRITSLQLVGPVATTWVKNRENSLGMPITCSPRCGCPSAPIGWNGERVTATPPVSNSPPWTNSVHSPRRSSICESSEASARTSGTGIRASMTVSTACVAPATCGEETVNRPVAGSAA